MGYTVSKVAERTGLTISTLRYYDKEGLLPFVDRTAGGARNFKESDFEWLAVITCLKQTGMPIKRIKQFIDWCLEGDATLERRLNVFVEHKKEVNAQIAALKEYMKKIDYKIWYYETAISAGTEAVHNGEKCKLLDKDAEENDL
ncbi:MAG: MerR family transcriptional regulator [Firmicutes bacterium]|nr:MerR family transcriptional regulator [Bacillota bacterium]